MGKGGIIRKNLPFLIIAAVCIIAFRQVVFLQGSLKYDILDGYLPGHYFMSECLRNNIFPLWNPYTQLGFPVYADMLSTNYIVDMFIGRLFPYTNITFHVLFIVYVILAGTGVYKLSLECRIKPQYSLLTAIAYGLSGFITGNAQHIQFIIGAAWLPYSVLYFIMLSRELQFKHCLLFVIFTILLITGGYPSFAIMLGYGLFPFFLFYLILYIKTKEYRKALRLFLFSILSLGLLALLSGGMLISIVQSTPYVERYAQLPYEYAVTNPFTPVSLISLISPMVTAFHPEMFQTDVSMNNHYFGVILIILLVYSLSIKIKKDALALLISALLLMIFTFGEYGFLHRFFFEYVPLFNKFRHPAAFRFITILLLVLFTGIQISRQDPSDKHNFDHFKRIYLVSVFVILAICIASGTIILVRLPGSGPKNIISDFGIFGPLLIQTAVFLVINIIFIYHIIIRIRLKWFYPLITLVVATESIVFTSLNLQSTVISEHDPLDIRKFLRNSPAGFPLPDNYSLDQHTEESAAHFPVIHNTNTYSKSISPYYKYPFVLNGFKKLESDTFRFNEVIRNKLLYFENKIQGDTIICHDFSPLRMVFQTKSSDLKSSVLLQNNYPGWSVTIDGKQTDHGTVHKSLIGFEVPSGTHEVVAEFRNPVYVYATMGSFALIVILILVVPFLPDKNKLPRNRYLPIIKTGIIILSVLLVLKPVKSFAEISVRNYQIISTCLDSIPTSDSTLVLFNIGSQVPLPERISKDNALYMRFRRHGDESKLWRILDTAKGDKMVYVWYNVPEITGTENAIRMNYPLITSAYSGERFKIIQYSRDSIRGRKDVTTFFNDYEKQTDHFTRDGIIRDSSFAVSGKYSEKLTGNRSYSSIFRRVLQDENVEIFSSVRFFKTGSEPCHLVIAVNRKGEAIYYDAVDIENFRVDHEAVSTAFISKSFLKSSLRKNDELVVYCWNSGNNEAVFLDDFMVKIE